MVYMRILRFLKSLNVYDLEAGDEASALNEPFFDDPDPRSGGQVFWRVPEQAMNKTLDVRNFGKFTITGVLKKITEKTHLRFEGLASVATMFSLEKALLPDEADYVVTTNWQNYYRTYTFALLQGKSEDDLTTALNELANKHYEGLVLESRDAGYRFHPSRCGASRMPVKC